MVFDTSLTVFRLLVFASEFLWHKHNDLKSKINKTDLLTWVHSNFKSWQWFLGSVFTVLFDGWSFLRSLPVIVQTEEFECAKEPFSKHDSNK